MRSSKPLCPRCGKELVKIPDALYNNVTGRVIKKKGDFQCVNCLDAPWGSCHRYYFKEDLQ